MEIQKKQKIKREGEFKFVMGLAGTALGMVLLGTGLFLYTEFVPPTSHTVNKLKKLRKDYGITSIIYTNKEGEQHKIGLFREEWKIKYGLFHEVKKQKQILRIYDYPKCLFEYKEVSINNGQRVNLEILNKSLRDAVNANYEKEIDYINLKLDKIRIHLDKKELGKALREDTLKKEAIQKTKKGLKNFLEN